MRLSIRDKKGFICIWLVKNKPVIYRYKKGQEARLNMSSKSGRIGVCVRKPSSNHWGQLC